MYSHDALGLGHFRRCIKIAKAITEKFSNCSILILCGSSLINHFKLPKGVDVVVLPMITKKGNKYTAERLGMSIKDVIRVRVEIIKSTYLSFSPDIFIVDKKPIGIGNELLELLKLIRDSHKNTRVVLGLRDILDNPVSVRREFGSGHVPEVLNTCYDEIWVYGRKDLYNHEIEYSYPHSVGKKTFYTGYILNGSNGADNNHKNMMARSDGRRRILLTVGGGEDGHALIDTYLKALERSNKQIDFSTIIIPGPSMPEFHHMDFKKRCLALPRVDYCDSCIDLSPELHNSDLVVSMGGYNTICEIISARVNGLIVPRVFPRTEQLIRARLFHNLGALDYIDPSMLTIDDLFDKIQKSFNRRIDWTRITENLEGNYMDTITERIKMLLGSKGIL